MVQRKRKRKTSEKCISNTYFQRSCPLIITTNYQFVIDLKGAILQEGSMVILIEVKK